MIPRCWLSILPRRSTQAVVSSREARHKRKAWHGALGPYACIAPFQVMYEANRQFPSCLYTDHLIYSPDVPVFRDDNDDLLEEPYPLSFITAPAVNAGVVRWKEPDNARQIKPVMLRRMENLLAVGVKHGHDTLVLAAWGCGVFANNPEEVACWFAQHLTRSGLFRDAFRKIVFAVLDRSQENIYPTVHAVLQQDVVERIALPALRQRLDIPHGRAA